KNIAAVATLLALIVAWASKASALELTEAPASQNAAFQNTAGEDGPGTTFRVDVKLVNVFVTVTDENGAPVANLPKEAFKIYENDVPQKIAVFDRESELPISLVMAVDASLSTRKDLKLELLSARKFAHTVLRPVDAMALYQFSEVVRE